MFFVFSKEKIYTYIISILTVVFLFFIVGNFESDKAQVIEASSNLEALVPANIDVNYSENNMQNGY